MERKRKLTRRDIITRGAKGAAVTGGSVVGLKWVAPALLSVEGVSATGSLPDTNCWAIKVDPFSSPRLEDLINKPKGSGGNHCLPDTNTNVQSGANAAIAGYVLNASDKKKIVLQLPTGCTFAIAYSKAQGCDLQEGVAGKNLHTFTFYKDGKKKDVSNMQFIFCCPD